MMSSQEEKTALTTIALLEHRLQRIRILLGGNEEAEEFLQDISPWSKEQTVLARLAKVENGLSKLSNKSPALGGLLNLYAAHSDLFQPSTTDFPSTSLTTPELIAIVSSYATLFPTTASRLKSINDVPIPPLDSSATLISLQQRIARLELLQEAHARSVADLRLRSASVIQRWYELGVLGGGECWTEWEGRVMNVEKRVRRVEATHDREAKSTEAYQA
ncbi:hypothetical protein MMC07_005461 [Pseudocyphellaria aurata]|nr:hypothetical protein [Pseudocyphellaria aurata]